MAFPTTIVDIDDEAGGVELFTNVFVNSSSKVFVAGMFDADMSNDVVNMDGIFVSSSGKIFIPGMQEVDAEVEVFPSVFVKPGYSLPKIFFPMVEFEIINIPPTSGNMFEIAIAEPTLPVTKYTPRHYDGDISISLSGELFDVGISNSDLNRDTSLQTAILISILSDRRAAPSDTLPSAGDSRGWWADNNLGSKLWFYERAKITEDFLQLMAADIVESLSWMVTDGIAKKVGVQASMYDTNEVLLSVKITLPYYKNNARFFEFYYNVLNQFLRY